MNLKGRENVTVDGTKINIYANIGSVDHIGAVLANDAGGIGLFRSEFLYLENSDFPTEEQQFSVDSSCLYGLQVLQFGAYRRGMPCERVGLFLMYVHMYGVFLHRKS